MSEIEWLNQVLKQLENNRKKHLEAIKHIQTEVSHCHKIKKILKNNHV